MLVVLLLAKLRKSIPGDSYDLSLQMSPVGSQILPNLYGQRWRLLERSPRDVSRELLEDVRHRLRKVWSLEDNVALSFTYAPGAVAKAASAGPRIIGS